MTAGGVILAGGRSTRMGTSKAALEWHGTTLVEHVATTVERGVDGPVVVVGPLGGGLPELPARFRVLEDPAEGLGPQQGLAVGLEALVDEVGVAFVAATDLPFLEPGYVRAVVAALGDEDDVALPVIGGHHQPFAAAYRTTLAPVVAELVGAGLLKPAQLFERARVRHLDEQDVGGRAGVEAVRDLDEPDDYAAALEEPPRADL